MISQVERWVKAMDQANRSQGALIRLMKVQKTKNPLRRLMFDFLSSHDEVVQAADDVVSMMFSYMLQPDNDGKRWTEEETEMIVSDRAAGNSIEAIALQYGRSAQSVANRISQAVGIRQLEVRINGVIDGDLEGEHADGMFVGTLRKGKS